jgi:predicted NACHT family NTPase
MDQVIRLWDADTGRLLRSLEGHKSWIWSVAFAPNGNVIASGGGPDKTVRLWDTQTGRQLHALKGHTGKVRSVAFSPDGRTLASVSDDKTARLWDPRSGNLVRTLTEHASVVLGVAFSPDGARLATGGGDRRIRIWELPSGSPIRSLEGHANAIWSVAFSPNGKLLASASSDRSVRLWDLERGKLRWTFQTADGDTWSVVFARDGQRIFAASGNAIHVLDATNGVELLTLSGHSDKVRCLALSPDGATLASASDDLTINLWEIRTAAPAEGLTVPGLLSVASPGVGYRWELARSGDLQGVNFRVFAGRKQDSTSVITLTVEERLADRHGKRVATVKGHFNGMMESLQKGGFSDLKGSLPSIERPIPDRVAYSLSCRKPDGSVAAIRAVTLFGKNICLFQVIANSPEEADRLIQVADTLRELKGAAK